MTTETATRTIDVNALRNLGSEWMKGGKHRIYFNDLQELAGYGGLVTDHYNSGAIASATLDGRKISNSQAGRIIDTYRSAKLWYDVLTGKWWSSGLGDDDRDAIIAEIKRQATGADTGLTCRRCHTIGVAGQYPFSTNPSAGLCDDCVN